jgi:hypothetical protein
MPHIGEILKSIIEEQNLSYPQVGARIRKSGKTVPSYFSKSSLQLDLILTFCGALKVDLLKPFYEEEPLKSLRNDEITKLNNNNQKLTGENQHLREKLELAMDVIDAYKKAFILKDILERQFSQEVNTAYLNELKKIYKQYTSVPLEDQDQDDDPSPDIHK